MINEVLLSLFTKLTQFVALTTETALAIARDALLWLLEDPERIAGFLGTSGLSPAELRARAGDPDMLGAVLDHVMSEDDWVIAFALETDHPPQSLNSARAALPGGDTPHWT
jgi:hypothetical protein